MASITLHNLDEKLYKLIKQESKKRGESINKTIKELLNKHFGLTKSQEYEFDEFLGQWTIEDEKEFYDNTKDLNQIEEPVWK